ncbi:MAG: hypothetical protein LBL04_10335 [Bacteroidales bacterium]|nr:hypothetical protein [Bacteroidales bacterium]
MVYKIYTNYNTKLVAFVFGVKASLFAVPVRQVHELVLPILMVMRQRCRCPGRATGCAASSPSFRPYGGRALP